MRSPWDQGKSCNMPLLVEPTLMKECLWHRKATERGPLASTMESVCSLLELSGDLRSKTSVDKVPAM
jgi:hypothetical protein